MSDLGVALVVFGVIGYFTLRHCCHRTGFRWDALEWQQNVFESTATGLALFAAGGLTAPLLSALAAMWKPSQSVVDYVKNQLPFPFTGTVVAGTVVGLLVTLLANWRWPKDQALAAAVRHHGGSLRILLHDANRTNRTVMLTLSNRKVYVGWVFTPPPLRNPSHVVMFPTLSGHRASETLAVAWTTNYSPAYADIIERKGKGEAPPTDLEHFQLVIPLDTVASATYFDIEVYDRHFAPVGSGNSGH